MFFILIAFHYIRHFYDHCFFLFFLYYHFDYLIVLIERWVFIVVMFDHVRLLSMIEVNFICIMQSNSLFIFFHISHLRTYHLIEPVNLSIQGFGRHQL